MKLEIKNIIFYVIFMVVCAVIIFAGITSVKPNVDFMKTAVKTEGVVTYVSSTSDRIHYTITVNNQKYQYQVVDNKDKTIKLGDTKTLYYNPENPSEIRDGKNPYMGYVVAAFGGLFEILIIYKLVKDVKNMKEGK